MSQERRKHQRFESNMGGEFSVPGTDITGLLETDNFSRGGFKAVLNRKVSLHSTLEFEITFPETIVPVFSTGKIVWIKNASAESSAKFEAGIQMEKIDPLERQNLVDYCYRRWNKARTASRTEFTLDE